MTGRDILVLCQYHPQFQDFRRKWELDYAMRQRAHFYEPDQMADRFDLSYYPCPDRFDLSYYPCPDRLHFYRGHAQQVNGRIVNIIAQTGTWYQRRHIHDELLEIRHSCPEAEWINDTQPLHVFAINEADFRDYCNSRFLNPNDGHEAVFVSPDSSLSPETFHQRFPMAHFDMTYHYLTSDRRSTQYAMRDSRNTQTIPMFDSDGPTTWVNVPGDTPRPSIDDMIDAMRAGVQAVQDTPWGWTSSIEWPEWIETQDRAFLEGQFHTHTHMKHVCIEMLEEVHMGRTWDYFAQRKSLAHLTCYLMHTHKVKVLLAKHWAKSYLDLYRLCGGHS